MWKGIQKEQHAVDASSDSFWYKALSMQLLRQEIPSKVGYEEAWWDFDTQ